MISDTNCVKMAPALNTYDRKKRRTVAANRHDTLCVRALFGFLLAIKDFTVLWRQQSWRKNDVNSDNQQKVLAYVFGQRKDEVFLRLQELLKPFGITKFYTDGWGAYERHLDAEQHQVGKENTQKIESKHINLRTRIKRLMRRTLCFSKTERMHDLVIGLFINRYEFGRSL